MTFNFYTYGGKFAWEDFFFYQGWRIQRHSKYKDYRLLDNFDILRSEGSYEECYQSFILYAKAYEMPKEKPHAVILLHGLAKNKESFNKMLKKMENEKFMAIAVNYPIRRKKSASLAKQIDALIGNLSDINEISFISSGAGGIVLRQLLSKNNQWANKIKVKKVLQIMPPNRGSRLFNMLAKFWIFRFILGPILKELTTEQADKIPEFNKSIDLGIISSDYSFKKFASLLPRKIRENMPSQIENAIKNEHKSTYIQNNYTNILGNEKIIKASINFINSGKFN